MFEVSIVQNLNAHIRVNIVNNLLLFEQCRSLIKIEDWWSTMNCEVCCCIKDVPNG
jgi:hypothetical protein